MNILTKTTNPSEGVSTQTSGTDKSTEQILNDLHKVKGEWKLDLGDFISFVSKKNKEDEEYESDLENYRYTQIDVVQEEGNTFDFLDEYDLWDTIETLIYFRISYDLEEEQRIVLDYLDGEVV